MPNFDYSEERSDLVPGGTYEATAECLGVGVNNFGDEVIRLSWRIRSDVEQAAKNRIVFDDIRKDKNDPNAFNDRKIYDIVFGGQDKTDPNAKFKFDSYDEICQHLNGINMQIDVEVRSSANGRQYNCVKFGGYHPTKAKGKTIAQPQQAVKSNTEDFEVTDDELPF